MSYYTTGALLYLITWCLSPPLAYGVFFRILAIVALGIVVICRPHQSMQEERKTYLMIGGLIGYILLCQLFTGDSFAYRIGTCIFLALMICSLFIEHMEGPGNLIIILYYTLLLLTLWNLTTLKGLFQYANVARLLAKNTEDAVAYSRRGIGGFGYIYSVLLMMPMAIGLSLDKNHSTLLRIVAIVFLVTAYLLLFKAAYFLATILAVMIPVLFYLFKMKKSRYRFLYFATLIAVFALTVSYADSILLGLHDMTEIRSVKAKLWDCYQLLNGEESIDDTDFATRQSRYSHAFCYALTHPVFGGITYRCGGNHSHLLDFAAQYGMIIFAFYIFLLLNPFRIMLKAGETSIQVTISILTSMLFMNTLAFAFGAIVFITLPAFFKLSNPTMPKTLKPVYG